MKRCLFNLVVAASLVLCVASAVLWVRSSYVDDLFFYGAAGGTYREIRSTDGIAFFRIVKPCPVSYPFTRRSSTTGPPPFMPSRAGGDYWLPGWLMLVKGVGAFGAPTAPQVPWSGMMVYYRGPAIATALLPLLWLTLNGRRTWQRITEGYPTRNRRLRAGLCPACGYDLRASIERCPECGAAIPEDLVRKPLT